MFNPGSNHSSQRLLGGAALRLVLLLILGAMALAVFSSCTDGPQSAEAAYAAAARKAVERTAALKKQADVAVANGDKQGLKQAADELNVEYVYLQELTPPPQIVEFHTTVVQQVSVVYETAEQIVVQDLPPEEAQAVWQEASVEWETWWVEVWVVWVEEISEPDLTPEDEGEGGDEGAVVKEVSDFDGDYEGEGSVTCTDIVETETFPLSFTVEGNQMVDASGIVASIDSSGRMTWTWAPDPTIQGDAFATFEEDPISGEVNMEGTWSGTVSIPGPDYPAVTCSGSFAAARVSSGVE